MGQPLTPMNPAVKMGTTSLAVGLAQAPVLQVPGAAAGITRLIIAFLPLLGEEHGTEILAGVQDGGTAGRALRQLWRVGATPARVRMWWQPMEVAAMPVATVARDGADGCGRSRLGVGPSRRSKTVEMRCLRNRIPVAPKRGEMSS